MIYYKTDEEIELIRKSCLLVCQALAEVAAALKPGVTGLYLDAIAEQVIRDHGGAPAFKGYRGFPGTLCLSFNEQVVHGIPSKREVLPGDALSVDCGVKMNGFFGDAAFTFAIGEVTADVLKLLQTTKESLVLGIRKAIAGNRIGDISYAVQEHCELKHHYGVVRELVGHGVGKSLHESPEVPNFGKRGKGIVLKEGLVIAIEPMVNLGDRQVRQANDGWTIFTRDRKVSAHYEHTVAVTTSQPDVLSDHGGIEEAIKKNTELQNISINI